MARVITEFKAFATYIDEPITTRCIQVYSLKFTQASSDLVMDIGNVTGTFWTEAGVGAIGSGALLALSQLIGKADLRVSLSAPEILDAKTSVGTAGTLSAVTQYQFTTVSIVPSFLFFAAGAPVTVNLVLKVILKKEERGIRAGSI